MRIAGRHSREIEAILGFRYDEALVHRDDLVLLVANEQAKENAA
jgi:glutamate 5-kinase